MKVVVYYLICGCNRCTAVLLRAVLQHLAVFSIAISSGFLSIQECMSPSKSAPGQTHRSVLPHVSYVDACGPILQAADAGDGTATVRAAPWQVSVLF